MSIGALGLIYVSIGVAIAAIGALLKKLGASDLLFLFALWPLATPLLLFVPRGEADPVTAELVTALARAQASPLASVLPDTETARVLTSRLREAAARLVDLDDVLARPDFDEASAQQRAAELAARGASGAAATVQLRIRTLGQLRALRVRYRAELDEVRELIAQLVTQAELVRLQPAIAQASTELVRELVTRVEGLGDLFAYQATLEHAEYPVPVGRS